MTETTCGHPNHGGIDHDCAPFVSVSGDDHNQAHDCATCGPCADDHRIRQGCYDGACCQPTETDDAGVSR